MFTKNNDINSDLNEHILKSRKNINLYRRAINLFLSRIRWDLKLESWRSRKKMNVLKNIFLGQKAVILCNGPSLLKSDFQLLKDVYCFGLNKINLLFEKSNFRPNSIVAVNSYVIEQNENFYNETEIPLFLDSSASASKKIKSRKNITFLHSSPYGFARDCSLSINQGYTVTYAALQLAFHMGFREIALIGADHNYATKGPANKLAVAEKIDESHFDPKYFSDGMKWELPDLFQSEVSYTLARDVYKAFGGKVVNATEGGYLEVFERQSLRKFIEKS